MRQKVAMLATSAPQTATAKLGGRDARHLTWSAPGSRMDLMLLKRDATLYGLLAFNADGSKSTLETARNAFALLE